MPEQPERRQPGLSPGTKVEVRSRYEPMWASGFEVADVNERGYRVRRLSDRAELPTEFDAEEVRAERRRRAPWWY